MAHSSHNRRGGSGFALVILGALLLFLAPVIYPADQALGGAALVGGFAIGGLGFYLRFLRYRGKGSSFG